MTWFDEVQRAQEIVRSGDKYNPRYDAAYRLVSEQLYEQLTTKEGREVTWRDIESAARAYSDFVGRPDTPDDPKIERGEQGTPPPPSGGMPGVGEDEDDPKLARGKDDEDDPKRARDKKDEDKDKDDEDRKDDEEPNGDEEDDEEEDDTGGEDGDQDEDQVDKWEHETGTGMPTVDGEDDYVGVRPRFGGRPGEPDPLDVSDTRRILGFEATDDPGTVDPWDRYDDVGGAAKVYGGMSPRYRGRRSDRSSVPSPQKRLVMLVRQVGKHSG